MNDTPEVQLDTEDVWDRALVYVAVELVKCSQGVDKHRDNLNQMNASAIVALRRLRRCSGILEKLLRSDSYIEEVNRIISSPDTPDMEEYNIET